MLFVDGPVELQQVTRSPNRPLPLYFTIRKIFPVYEGKTTQCDLIDFGKCFRIPIGPESCRIRSDGGCGSVVGNIVTTEPSILIRAGKYHKPSLFSPQHR